MPDSLRYPVLRFPWLAHAIVALGFLARTLALALVLSGGLLLVWVVRDVDYSLKTFAQSLVVTSVFALAVVAGWERAAAQRRQRHNRRLQQEVVLVTDPTAFREHQARFDRVLAAIGPGRAEELSAYIQLPTELRRLDRLLRESGREAMERALREGPRP